MLHFKVNLSVADECYSVIFRLDFLWNVCGRSLCIDIYIDVSTRCPKLIDVFPGFFRKKFLDQTSHFLRSSVIINTFAALCLRFDLYANTRKVI